MALYHPGALPAQVVDAPESRHTVGASVGAFLRGGQVRGDTEAILGGEASIRFSRHLSLGAAGAGLLRAVPITASGADLGTDLHMGYGGLLFGYRVETEPSVSVAGRVLLGAGHATVRAVPIGNELGADNFLVVEPEVVVTIRARGPLHLGVSAGYRWVGGVQDLPTVDGGDLEGPSLTVSLSIS